MSHRSRAPLAWTRLTTRFGVLALGASEEGLAVVDLRAASRPSAPDRATTRSAGRADAVIEVAVQQLREYDQGIRREFTVPVDLDGTPFQRQVWRALLDIPFGQTVSYAEVARRVGRPAAARAVGMAVGRNPVPIVVPCHRVVGRDGRLTGYGGGLPLKQALLVHEGALLV